MYHRYKIVFHLAIICLLILLAVITGCSDNHSAQSAHQMPPAAVTLHPVTSESITLTAEYAGRVRGSREVEVRARVGGVLQERLYVEGQRVDEGAPLFRLDGEIYEIALRRAEAERQNASASLDNARREVQRLTELRERNAVSQRDLDQATTAQELAEAQLNMAEAAVADAQRNLRYTLVTAPLSGFTGMESLPEGSLIEAGTLLTRVTRHDPVHVHFALPENDTAARELARRALAGASNGHRFDAQLLLPDGSEYKAVGEVNFTNSSIDPRTGSISARAVFPNPQSELVPGQFVRIRLTLETLDNVALIPAAALVTTPQGNQVFVIDSEQKASARAVETGPVVQGQQVILSGLEVGDQLVVNGQVALRDGAPVRVVNGD